MSYKLFYLKFSAGVTLLLLLLLLVIIVVPIIIIIYCYYNKLTKTYYV